MKKIILALAATLVSVAAAAQAQRHLDPAVVSLGKELPRSGVVSHDSKADAVRQTYGASKYLQPLTEWTRTEDDEAVRYKSRFKIPFGWIDREQFLYVGRTSASFDVVVNGAHAAYSQTGTTPSEFDITRASKEGANELEIVIYKTPVAQKLENGRPPAAPRIEGEVHILSQPRTRVRDVAVSTRIEGSSGLLELGVILKSHQLNAHDYTVYWELLNPLGEILAEGRKDARLDMRREDTVRFFANIPAVVPWSHEEPRLYTLFIKTQNEGRFREYLSFKVGFRSLDLQDDGNITLNGVPLDLVMRDFAPTGDMAAMREAIEQLRAGGVNALMLRGAPPSREFYALCDSMGVYVSCRADIDTRLSGDSRKVGGNPSNDPAWKGAYLDRTMAMYHTSKNHPSVAMFSLAEHSANGHNLYESYLALKALEPHRPVLYADGGGEWNTDELGSSASSTERRGSLQAAEASREGNNSDWLSQSESSTETRLSAAGRRGEVEGDNVSSTERRPSLQAVEASREGNNANWLTLEAVNVAEGRFRLSNSRRITPLTGTVLYKIVVGRKTVSSGSQPVEVLPEGASEFTVPITGVKEGKNYAVELEIAVERTDGDYLPGSDPDLKVFRRLDLPLAEANRTIIASGKFNSD